MQKQSGNFLLQALLAMSLLFLFIPLVTGRLATRAMNEKISATVQQVDLVQTAARIYIRENAKNIAYDTTVISGNDFADILEPYGLPLGFVPHTPMGQEIKLIINKSTENGVSGYFELSGGDLSEIQRAEIVRRIGFYAADSDGVIIVGVPLNTPYQDIVKRNESDFENSGFLTDLDMGNFNINNAESISAQNGQFETAQIDTLSISGNEAGRNSKNVIKNMFSEKTVFQSNTGETALTINRGTLSAKTIYGKTVAKYGDTGNFASRVASVADFAMTAGRTGFTGGAKWNVGGNLYADRTTFSVERLDISSYLNVASGQDVYVNENTLEYSSNSGISADVVYVSNITLRDQTSSAINNGSAGNSIIDIRPAGTSLLPDVYVDTVSNDEIKILKEPNKENSDMVSCKEIISNLNMMYDKRSLAQNIICQYMFWQRLETRINIKQCLMAGQSDCEK